MLRGFYTAASGILMQERAINVLTNNIVNAETPGYRASRVVSTTFEQELMTRMEQFQFTGIGTGAQTRIVSEVPTRFDSSLLEETLRPFDVAVNGAGFFVISAEDGTEYLTRNGNFDIDEEGYLILRNAGRVQSMGGGDIQVNGSDFLIAEDGVIYDAEGGEIATLAVVGTPEDAEIRLNRNGLYTTDNMAGNEQVEGVSVVQGWLERSNIDVGQEYTAVMEAQRAFQACSTALQILDRLNQKAATQIAAL